MSISKMQSKPGSSGKVPLERREDELAMGTNNSSIASKRSVERLYYPDENFYRPFVKKPQRRSPAINRGYWLQMQALEYAVLRFLDEPSENQKLVINLGCGYDPLPFRCFQNYPERCNRAKFVDVDYMQLMIKKCEVIKATEDFRRHLTGAVFQECRGATLLNSNNYLALGCDLRDLEALENALVEMADIRNCSILFTAEVSIIYMDVEAADSLIKWAAKFDKSNFCLLEQFLPGGQEHPFAKTMLSHFQKLSTPLKSISKYPLMKDQHERFRDAGWPLCGIHDLWGLWSRPEFLSADQRRSLNTIEPFDKWEEFALFASHYFLLFARKPLEGLENNQYELLLEERTNEDRVTNTVQRENITQITYHASSNHQGRRRFAAAAPLTDQAIAYHGGLGTTTRLNSTEVIFHGRDSSVKIPTIPGQQPRMCHTLTCLERGRFLLIGGRISPDNALADCWIYSPEGSNWHQVEDLPIPRYRHCAVEITNSRILVFGGKDRDGNTLNDCCVWTEHSGWRTVQLDGEIPMACFGAAMIAADNRGILLGGMTAEGTVLKAYLEWEIDCNSERYSIRFRDLSSQFKDLPAAEDQFCRFGASLAWSPFGSGLLLVGGIHGTRLLDGDNEILSIDTINHSVAALGLKFGVWRPLLVGCSVVSRSEGVMVIGGGAVCFSFGTFWNDGLWVLSNTGGDQHPWRFQETSVESQTRAIVSGEVPQSISGSVAVVPPPAALQIPRVLVKSAKDFEEILKRAQPVILDGLHIGDCTKKWSFGYLKDRVGAERQVIVHKATAEHMNFLTKNFSYTSQGFGQFLDGIEEGQQLYLRSLSLENPINKPADLSHDFPEISEDFKIPSELAYALENVHSSPLRISGPVMMWLHYDVMANILCQVRGSKRLLLYPLDDVAYLKFAPGMSSSSINVFEANSQKHPSLALTRPHEAILHPGDILFIPALWPHTASPTAGTSVAVNVFFRNLKMGYAIGKDVYGNRDLQPYEKGRLDIKRIVKSFEQLPMDIGRFYLQRLADELTQETRSFGVSEISKATEVSRA